MKLKSKVENFVYSMGKAKSFATPVVPKYFSGTGDVFASKSCDCEEKLHSAMKRIDDEGCGVILYLYQDTGKTGFLNAPEGNIQSHEHKEHQLKDYGFGAMILKQLGLRKIKLLTNSPKIMKCISAYGLEIDE